MTANEKKLEITTSRHFNAWMASENLSLAFTTYQTGKLFMIGLKPDGRLSVFERTFPRAMGMCASADEFHMSTDVQIWRFRNVVPPGEHFQGYDRYYAPRTSWITGDIDVHDMAVGADGRLYFINTLFGCLATKDDDYSFRPLWKPPFLSKLAAEDRCHLNGLAMKDGKPKYVTAVSRSDVADGWRDRRSDGGIVMDTETNEIVAEGFSMPHSPRVWQDRLWLLNSGAGWFGWVDTDTGEFNATTFCPGYARGLSFHGNYAVIGLSAARENRTFKGLPLDEELKRKDAEDRCGLMVVDMATGDAVHWMRIEGVVRELYDVCALPGVRRPMLMGFKTDDVKRVLSQPPDALV